MNPDNDLTYTSEDFTVSISTDEYIRRFSDAVNVPLSACGYFKAVSRP